MKKYKPESEKKQVIKEAFRSVEVVYFDGTVISTDMSGHLTDQQIKDYFRIGQAFNIGRGGVDKMVKVKQVNILN